MCVVFTQQNLVCIKFSLKINDTSTLKIIITQSAYEEHYEEQQFKMVLSEYLDIEKISLFLSF